MIDVYMIYIAANCEQVVPLWYISSLKTFWEVTCPKCFVKIFMKGFTTLATCYLIRIIQPDTTGAISILQAKFADMLLLGKVQNQRPIKNLQTLQHRFFF